MIQHSLGCYKPLTAFQSSDKVGFERLLDFSGFFFLVEGQVFGLAYSALLADIRLIAALGATMLDYPKKGNILGSQ